MTDFERTAFQSLLRQGRDPKTGEFTASDTAGAVDAFPGHKYSDKDLPKPGAEKAPAPKPETSRPMGTTADGKTVANIEMVKGDTVNAGKMMFARIDGEDKFVKFSSAQDRGREAGARVLNDALGGLVTMPGAKNVEFGDLQGEAAKFSGKEGLVVDRVTGTEVGESGHLVENTFIDNPRISTDDLKDLAAFDTIAGNVDRHPGQAMFYPDGTLASVDHGLCFFDNTYKGSGGNYYVVAALKEMGVDMTLTDHARSSIETLLADQERTTQALIDAGVKATAIPSVFARAQALLDQDRLPVNQQAVIKSDGKEGFRAAFESHVARLVFLLP